MKWIFLFSFLFFFIGCQTTETNTNNTKNANSSEKKELQENSLTPQNSQKSSNSSEAKENFSSNSSSEKTTNSSKKQFQKTNLGDIQKSTNLEEEATALHKDFNYEDQLLIAASLSSTVVTEAMSKLRNSPDTEIYLVCNKRESKFQIITKEELVLKAWNLPKGIKFHQPQDRKLLKYAKEFSINPETQRKQLEKEWIEYEDFTIPNGEEILPYAFLLITPNDRKCIVDINKITGDPHVMVLN